MNRINKYFKFKIEITLDSKFWALIPALNLNLHGMGAIEFEWLILGIYVSRTKQND